MKIISLYLIILLSSSCFLNKERRQWNSKRYPDEHFYNVLSGRHNIDTSQLKLNHFYICKNDSGFYRQIMFTEDKKLFGSSWTKELSDSNSFANKQVLLGYYFTRKDSIIIEEIGTIYFHFFGAKRKGTPLVFRHFKYVGIANGDTVALSTIPQVFKKSEWDDKNNYVFAKPIKYIKAK